MSRKKKNNKNRKQLNTSNQPPQKSQSIQSASNQSPVFDYDKFRDSMVEAYQIVLREEKATVSDPLTDSFRTMLSYIFKIFIGLSLFVLPLLIYFSITFTRKMYTDFLFVLCCAFWALAVVIFTLTIFNSFITQKLKGKGKKAYRYFAIASVITCFTAYIITIYSNPNISFFMIIGIISMFITFACWNNLKYLKKEADRAFLIACFSGIVSLLALVVAVVTLIVTIIDSKL